MAVEIEVKAWDRHDIMAALNKLMGSQTLENWIFNDNRAINKQLKKKHEQMN